MWGSKNPEKKNIYDSDLCLHRWVTAPFTAAVKKFLDHSNSRLVKLKSQTLIIGLLKSLLPLQVTLACLGQFSPLLGRLWEHYSISKILAKMFPKVPKLDFLEKQNVLVWNRMQLVQYVSFKRFD